MKSRSPSKITPCYFNQDKLKIIIRIRPIINDEDSHQFVQLEDNNTLQIKRPGNHTYMKFNNILPPLSHQEDVFFLLQDSIRQFLQGINITIFAYGQTGAGKTYSMIGNYSPKDSQQNLFNFLKSKQKGVLSRSLEMILKYTEKKSNMRVFVSFFQIYNDKIFDLYNNTVTPLEIRESKNGQISIPQLVNVQVIQMKDAIQYLMIGLKNRATGSTHGNAQSSRSHSIFQINLQRTDSSRQVFHSSLRIVDLAGSQKFKIPSDLSPTQKQTRIQQLTAINTSLSCLGHCISALIQKSRTHIPFRNSKLTRILSDSLIGQGKMRFIICISPSCSASAETFSTLQFANRAKKAIFQRSQMRTPNLSKKKSSQNEQIIILKRELQRQRQQRILAEKQLFTIKNQRPEGCMKQNAYLRKQNQKLKHQLKQLMAKRSNQRDSSPRIHHGVSQDTRNCQGNQPDLREEMLKLPIFQNCGGNNLFHDKQNKKSQHEISLQKSHISMKKKAQFEKKIKKFIEADSPENIQEKEKNEYYQPSPLGSNFNNLPTPYCKQNRGQKQKIPVYYQNEQQQQYQWNQNQDTQQFIQKACEQMNLPDFKDLKCEVERAKNQLQLLKQKDDEISKRKLRI